MEIPRSQFSNTFTKQIKFIDRFIIDWYITSYTANITINALNNYVSATKAFVGVLLYVAYKLNIPVTKALKNRLLVRSYRNPKQIQSLEKSELSKLLKILKQINTTYHADPVIKSMMTSWTQIKPDPKSEFAKVTGKVLDLKHKYVNKQGYIKHTPGVVYQEGTTAPYILHNSFFNMYEISYISNPKRTDMYTVYKFNLYDKSGTEVVNGLFVLVDLLNLMSSSLDITKTTNADYTSRVNMLKNLCKDLIRYINNVDPDPHIKTLKTYTDNTFLKIKTILEQLDKLYKTDPVFRGFIDSYNNFTAIQFIQLPPYTKPPPVWRDIKDIPTKKV